MPREPSFYEARPSLGASVDAVLRAWRDATQATNAPAQRVRALLTTGKVGEWEFGWQEGVIHRILSARCARPITPSEQELLRMGIVHGWLFVYLTEEGQEPVVLHAVGIEAQDSPESPLFSTLVTPEGKGISRQEGERVEEIELPDNETPRQEEPSPVQPGDGQECTVKRPARSRLLLLLLGGAVVGGGVMGWLLTRRGELGLVLALFVLVVLNRKIKHVVTGK